MRARSCFRCRCGWARIEEFVEQTRTRIRNADAALLLIDPDLAPFYEPVEGDPPAVLLGDLMPGKGRPTPDAYDAVSDDLDRLAILQFTSGSTSEPKGVMLPQRVLCSNLDAIVASDRRSTSTSTCSSRGCRCTTTWASSAA